MTATTGAARAAGGVNATDGMATFAATKVPGAADSTNQL
jgi:hypothetical protein